MIHHSTRRGSIGLILASAIAAAMCAGARAAEAECTDDAWREFEQRLVAAQAAFVRADPEPIKSLWSHTTDVSLFGAYGGHEVGWNAVGSRLTWVSPTNSNGSHDDDVVLTKIVGADLALVVQLENITHRNPDGSIASVQHLRVTHVARCADSAWRLVHRHADPLIETRPPSR
jgi:hypothetical protein